ncbi:hypothetical protein H6P81_021412 [Aristolochia fimbriata]|uniref:Uncharacterized protein n=1 Tax=Aristolochia fimbriata TaxID=158543 RepID=A0AAV7DQZ0_ARIFI|nr:hypothetical protein H6P81_021412 [Aristolochia fimbriata]
MAPLLARHAAGASGVRTAARASGARWTCASGASGRMSRRLVAPSSLHCTDLPRPCWVAGIPLGISGVSVYFPLRLSLAPGCASERPDAAVFMDPCECGSPMDLVGLAKRV